MKQTQSKSLKKVCEQQGGVKTIDNENLKPVIEMEGLSPEAGEDINLDSGEWDEEEDINDEDDEDNDEEEDEDLSVDSGELYKGVTDDAEESRTAEYRMITKSDDTVSSQGS